MGWDSTRPVPWRRLLREYAIYAAIMAVVLLVLTRGRDALPLLGGLLMAGPIYIGLGVVTAKFGYQRKTLADLRTPRASAASSSPAPSPSSSSGASAVVPRDRPAPTRRTSAGRNQPPRPSRRKR